LSQYACHIQCIAGYGKKTAQKSDYKVSVVYPVSPYTKLSVAFKSSEAETVTEYPVTMTAIGKVGLVFNGAVDIDLPTANADKQKVHFVDIGRIVR
jgi:hypothetical protein